MGDLVHLSVTNFSGFSFICHCMHMVHCIGEFSHNADADGLKVFDNYRLTFCLNITSNKHIHEVCIWFAKWRLKEKHYTNWKEMCYNCFILWCVSRSNSRSSSLSLLAQRTILKLLALWRGWWKTSVIMLLSQNRFAMLTHISFLAFKPFINALLILLNSWVLGIINTKLTLHGQS